MFQLGNCDFGVKIGGVDYRFPHVVNAEIEDPERNRLTRGANARNSTGIVYKEGLREPKTWTFTVLAMPAAVKAVLDSAYEGQERMDVYAIDRKTGSKKMANDAILGNQPLQLTIDETADTMNVTLEFQSFKMSETIKEG